MVEIISSGERKARKNHICDFCGGEIVKGNKYNYQYNKYEGETYSFKTHLECSKVAEHYKMYDNDNQGLTGDNFQEIVNEKIPGKIPLSGKIRLLYNNIKGDK